MEQCWCCLFITAVCVATQNRTNTQSLRCWSGRILFRPEIVCHTNQAISRSTLQNCLANNAIPLEWNKFAWKYLSSMLLAHSISNIIFRSDRIFSVSLSNNDYDERARKKGQRNQGRSIDTTQRVHAAEALRAEFHLISRPEREIESAITLLWNDQLSILNKNVCFFWCCCHFRDIWPIINESSGRMSHTMNTIAMSW